MALQEHGTLQRSVQQQLEQLPIHLHQQIHVLQWYNGYHDQTQVTPTFTQIGPLCQNSTAPALPATSDNGFAGTWNPATISTATVGTTTYTFTPTDPCATTATMDITIGTQVTPTFTQIGPLCQNSTAPTLPATSDNGFAGTWNPATISTATVGTTTYTFTPTDPCATTATMDITIGTQVTPTFTADRTLFVRKALHQHFQQHQTMALQEPGNPATISTAAGWNDNLIHSHRQIHAATQTTMDVTITTQVTPTFTQIGPLCQNSTAPALPAHQTMALPEPGTLQRSVQQQ
jgi:hypothetical protein